MAEGILRQIAGDRFEITSAGADPAPIDAEAMVAMKEIGIDISRQAPKDMGQFLGQRFTYVISLCDRHEERTCPIFPGAVWPMEDPSTARSQAEHRALVRRLRDHIQNRVLEFANQN
jgi:arsenate reductase